MSDLFKITRAGTLMLAGLLAGGAVSARLFLMLGRDETKDE